MNKLLILLFLYTSIVKAQVDTISSKKASCENDSRFFFSTGISLQKQLVGEVGLLYGHSPISGPCVFSGLDVFKLATEFNFQSENFFIGPKLSYELDVLLIDVRINIIDYTDFTYHDIKFTPEIGLTFDGYCDLFYGYNFSINNSRIEEVGTHRLTLTYNFINK